MFGGPARMLPQAPLWLSTSLKPLVQYWPITTYALNWLNYISINMPTAEAKRHGKSSQKQCTSSNGKSVYLWQKCEGFEMEEKGVPLYPPVLHRQTIEGHFASEHGPTIN